MKYLSNIIIFFAVSAYSQQVMLLPRSKVSGNPEPMGLLYNKTTWDDPSEYITNGSLQINMDGNFVNYSNGLSINDFAEFGAYDILENYTMEAKARITGTINSTSHGIGIGRRSFNNAASWHNICRFIMDNTANRGKLMFYNWHNGSADSTVSSTALTINTTDSVLISIRRNLFDLTVTAKNGSGLISLNVPFDTGGADPLTDQTSKWAIWNFGGAFNVERVTISSDELKKAPWMLIGDSKTVGYTAGTTADAWSELLRVHNPKIVVAAGGNDKTREVLLRLPEMLSHTPRKVLLSIGSNDLRTGVSEGDLETAYALIVAQIEARGIEVWHVIPKEATGHVDMTNLISFVNTNYPGRLIDCSDLDSGGVLDPSYTTDGVHLNTAGHLKEYNDLLGTGLF